jgi:hypothetical protein
MNKTKKIAIISFFVLGFTGVAILKGKSIIDKIIDKKRLKRGLPQKEGLFSKLFNLPEDIKL